MSRKKKGNNNFTVQTGMNGFGMNFGDITQARKKCNSDEMYWQSNDYNTRLFMMFRAQIIGLALNRVKWINLPKTCDERFLEMTLLLQGCASIAFPKKMPGQFYSTQLAQVSRPNIYDNPVQWRAIGNNGFNFEANWSQGVVVWDNRCRYPLLEKIEIWARELVDIMRTKQLNRFNYKMPFIFSVPQEMQDQAVNLFKQVAGGEPAVIGTPMVQQMKPEVWQTGVEFIGEPLTAEMETVWNEIYQVLGIANQTFKMERVIEDEVRAHQEPSNFARLDYLQCRREAADKLNERFGELLYDENKPFNGFIKPVWNYDNLSENYDFTHNLERLIDKGGSNGAN